MQLHSAVLQKLITKKTEAEIGKCPPQTREAIWGNINTLKDRFEKGPDKVADISFTYKPSHDMAGWQGIGKIKVAGENQAVSSEFDLRKRTSPQEIWEDGFENITKKVLDDSFDNKDDNADKTIDETYNQYMKRKTKSSYNYTLESPKARKAIYEIADKLVQTPKIEIDKYKMATEIFLFEGGAYKNQDELTNCLINNFNLAMEKFENDLPEGKYKMSLSHEHFSHSHDNSGDYYIGIEQTENQGSKNISHLVPLYAGSRVTDDFKPKDAKLDNVDKAFQKLHDEFVWFAYENK